MDRDGGNPTEEWPPQRWHQSLVTYAVVLGLIAVSVLVALGLFYMLEGSIRELGPTITTVAIVAVGGCVYWRIRKRLAKRT